MGGESLAYAVGVVALLTCALAVSAIATTLDESLQDPKIVQVTDTHAHRKFGRHNGHRFLGTATEHRFRSFVMAYGKEYSTREEYVHRLGIFAENVVRAAEHQALDPTAVHGVTQFSDLSKEEFEAMYTGVRGGRSQLKGVVGTAPELEVGRLPKNFDWRKKGAVTEVKMQVRQGTLF